MNVNLTTREFAFFKRLSFAPDRVFSSENLTDTVWGSEGAAPGSVKVFVYQLRKKLVASATGTVSRRYRLGPYEDDSNLQAGEPQ
jgi:DNA-binding response OmpR family regulator